MREGSGESLSSDRAGSDHNSGRRKPAAALPRCGGHWSVRAAFLCNARSWSLSHCMRRRVQGNGNCCAGDPSLREFADT